MAHKLIRIGAFVFFCVAFSIGAFMSARILLERRAADKVYESLCTNVRTEMITINKVSATDSKAEQSAVEDDRIELQQGAVGADETGNNILVPRISMDFEPLQGENPDIKAWIFAEGTPIDYPIVQTDNNAFYLTHLYNGEGNSSGSIFLDYRNSNPFEDQNTVIYGHHMKNGSMFYSLQMYKDQNFYDENPTMRLYTPVGDYLIELICGTVEDGNYEFVQFEFANEEDFNTYIDAHRRKSTFISNVEVDPDDRIVTLCTCSYERNNARYMIIGKLSPIMMELSISTE